MFQLLGLLIAVKTKVIFIKLLAVFLCSCGQVPKEPAQRRLQDSFFRYLSKSSQDLGDIISVQFVGEKTVILVSGEKELLQLQECLVKMRIDSSLDSKEMQRDRRIGVGTVVIKSNEASLTYDLYRISNSPLMFAIGIHLIGDTGGSTLIYFSGLPNCGLFEEIGFWEYLTKSVR